jgi:hypothetical protein
MSWLGLVWDIRKPGSKALTYRNLDLTPSRQ